jgi:hypothetical protein
MLLAYFHVYGRDTYVRGCFAATRVRLEMSWHLAWDLISRRKAGKHCQGRALVDNRQAMWDSCLPWGRGEKLRKPVNLTPLYPSPTLARTQTHNHSPSQHPLHLPTNPVPQSPCHPRPPHRQALHPPARPLLRLTTRHPRRSNLHSAPLRCLIGT